MLNCEYCDYLKKVNVNFNGSKTEEGCYCKFTSFIFSADEISNLIEHPCKDFSYQDFLDTNELPEPVSVAKYPNWKIVYKKRYLVSEKKKLPIAG